VVALTGAFHVLVVKIAACLRLIRTYFGRFASTLVDSQPLRKMTHDEKRQACDDLRETLADLEKVFWS
jgi:hypothetical protein